jgi:hypothetical protein
MIITALENARRLVVWAGVLWKNLRHETSHYRVVSPSRVIRKKTHSSDAFLNLADAFKRLAAADPG